LYLVSNVYEDEPRSKILLRGFHTELKVITLKMSRIAEREMEIRSQVIQAPIILLFIGACGVQLSKKKRTYATKGIVR